MTTPDKPPRIPPRWFILTAWKVHRGLFRITGGRFGLRRPKPGKYGMLQLHTVGRHSGHSRQSILAYFEDGSDLILMAMNGWGEAHPGWWLNLKASPEAVVDLPGRERRLVRARESKGDERARLWDGYRSYSQGSDLDALAGLRSKETPIIVLEPA